MTTTIKISLPAKVLAEAIRRVTPAVLKDPNLPVLGCILFNVGPADSNNKRILTLTASDRYVAARFSLEAADVAGDPLGSASVAVPLGALPKLGSVGGVDLGIGNGALTLSLSDAMRGTTTISAFDGSFPNLDGVLSKTPLPDDAVTPHRRAFSAKVLTQLAKMAYGKNGALHFADTVTDRNGAVIVTIRGEDRFLGVAMPYRIDY